MKLNGVIGCGVESIKTEFKKHFVNVLVAL